MQYNTEGWKEFKNPATNKEMLNYDSWKKKAGTLHDVVVMFDSADSLVQHFMTNVAEVGGNGTWKTGDSGINHKNDMSTIEDWRFGKDFRTFNETISALQSGETAARYLRMLDKVKGELYDKYPELYKISETAVTKRRRRRFSEDGDELDIDRYMCGDPAMWSSMPRQEVQGRAATFFIDITISAGTDEENLVEGVIRSIALVDIVDKAGIPTEIVIGATTNNGTRGTRLLTVACKAKHANEPLDIQRILSFCMTGYYRSLTFCAWVNTSPSKEGNWGLGNGNYNLNDKYFDFFNAVVKTRCKDAYWSSDMEVNIKQISKFLNIQS